MSRPYFVQSSLSSHLGTKGRVTTSIQISYVSLEAKKPTSL